MITGDHPAPQIAKHRGARARKGDYYGPFASAGAVHRTITALQRAFLLRSCADSVFASRTRPCLLYQIKRCSAPCVGRISLEDYAGLVRPGARFPGGAQPRGAGAAGESRCRRPATALDFELAAALRDRLRALADGPGPSGHQCRGHPRRRCHRRPSGRRPYLRPGLLLPRRQQFRQSRLFPEP